MVRKLTVFLFNRRKRINKEYTLKLFEAFPELYRRRRKSLNEGMMSFVFECGDGWYDIIWHLSEDITRLANDARVEIPQVSQVKEKFGALRFYIGFKDNSISEPVHVLIREAERESTKTCEVCGAVGLLRNKQNWVRTTCEKHAISE
ncbi:MAG: hypothetical protein ABFS08_09830 [Pseudomonadota bacterium]